MKNIDINTVIAISSFAGGVGSTLLGAVRWYRESERRRFAAEREFEHLKRDNVQLREYVVELDQKIDDLTAAVVEMRGAISTLISRTPDNGVAELKLPSLREGV